MISILNHLKVIFPDELSMWNKKPTQKAEKKQGQRRLIEQTQKNSWAQDKDVDHPGKEQDQYYHL